MNRTSAALISWATGLLAVQASVAGGGFDRAIQSASPRVVKLYGLAAGMQEGYGTGVLVSDDGLVLTVFSLLLDAQIIRAVASDGNRYEADVLRRDSARQLALLKLKPSTESAYGRPRPEEARPMGPFPYFDVSREVSLGAGEWVLAAGNAFKVADGAEPVTIAHGVFSIRAPLEAQRGVKDFPYRGEVLVIDAITSNPGAPGSALVNLDGEFVGMIGRVVQANLTNTHFNYAMPRDVLQDFLKETPPPDGQPAKSASAEPSQPPFDWGIRMARTGYQKVLPFVERVRNESPAFRADVRKDDLILSVNGKSIADVVDYDQRMKEVRPGESIDLVIRRGRAIVTVRIEAKE